MNITSLEEIPKIREELRATFRSGVTKPIAWRRRQLLQLSRMVQDNADALADAIHADLNRPRLESYLTEIGPIVERSLISAERLPIWTESHSLADDVPDWQKSWSPKVHKEPKGNVLIISPWNYPLILSLQPLIGAIAAGCTAVIKPSEIAPHYAAVLAKLIPLYLDTSAYRIVCGAVPEITKLLELQWDHIFYTGNGRIARIISTAAAKHLTPLTLELGGKSPVIIDPNYDMELAAKRVLYGKINNSGQICVAPDFVLIPRSKQDEFVAALKKHYDTFFPEGALASDAYAAIVNDLHFQRLSNVLAKTKGEIVLGGKTQGRSFEPTIVANVQHDDVLMDEEIFGPILPLIAVDDVADAVKYINEKDHPLVLYAFSTDEKTQKYILEHTSSGGLVYNDTFQQLSVNELPFGGVGGSGYGRQGLKYTFDIFTYERGSIDIPAAAEPHLEVRYPPYTQEKWDVLAAASRLKIPDA